MPPVPIISQIPVHKLWDENGIPSNFERTEYLQLAEIRTLLKKFPIKFIIARIGDPLKFIPEEDCYSVWATELRDHVFDLPKGHVNLENLADRYGYLASKWTTDDSDDFVILLEEYESQ